MIRHPGMSCRFDDENGCRFRQAGTDTGTVSMHLVREYRHYKNINGHGSTR